MDLLRSSILQGSALDTFAPLLLCWPIIHLWISCNAERAHPSLCSYGKAKCPQENAASAMMLKTDKTHKEGLERMQFPELEFRQ